MSDNVKSIHHGLLLSFFPVIFFPVFSFMMDKYGNLPYIDFSDPVFCEQCYLFLLFAVYCTCAYYLCLAFSFVTCFIARFACCLHFFYKNRKPIRIYTGVNYYEK